MDDILRAVEQDSEGARRIPPGDTRIHERIPKGRRNAFRYSGIASAAGGSSARW
jgi:hypothetical protein